MSSSRPHWTVEDLIKALEPFGEVQVEEFIGVGPSFPVPRRLHRSCLWPYLYFASAQGTAAPWRSTQSH